jgi:30S ribosomal protein S31
MGKGDRRSRRGKLFRGTFGVTRKHKTAQKSAVAATATAATPKTEEPKKKAPRKKKEE